MAKIIFSDKSYIDCYKSTEPNKIIIVISAKDHQEPNKKITNAVELSLEEFNKLVGDIK